jgi:CelD/BcsL family acetyltransferase involved in cellulose biosynthesis
VRSPSREPRFVDPVTDPAWGEFVARSPAAKVFHHPAWLGLLQEQYGHEMRACCIDGPDGIEAGLPIARISSRLTGRRLVAMPFSDSCPPLLAEGAGDAALEDLALGLAEESCRSGLELTVRGSLPHAANGFVSERFVSHELELAPDPDETEAGMAKKQIRASKQARRNGLSSERRTDVEALDSFYSLHLKTRRRLGVPTQPRRFIRRFAELFEQGLGCVWVVSADGQPIAAAVLLSCNGTVTYKYSASDFSSLKKRPNNLLLMDAIRWSCEAGFRTFDFGRTELENEGLRDFKSSWGAPEAELDYICLADRVAEREREPASGSLRDRIMSTTIQRSPALVSRLAGEALYRHYG